jgi:cell wall-associated NlpC family hydrolase
VSLLQASRGLTTSVTDHRSASDLDAALARRQAWIGDYPRAAEPPADGKAEVTPSEGTGLAPDTPPPAGEPNAAPEAAMEGRDGPAEQQSGDVHDWDGVNKAPSAPSPARRRVDAMVHDALTARGIRYRWGGTSRGGFDCSGFTRYMMAKNLGIKLPHSAHAQAHYGQKIGLNDLKEGDLVFFRTYSRGISHVGIYLGDNRFIHAPRTGRSVSVESLTGYYLHRFVTARRLTGTGPPG